jgi:hypothetical protein
MAKKMYVDLLAFTGLVGAECEQKVGEKTIN